MTDADDLIKEDWQFKKQIEDLMERYGVRYKTDAARNLTKAMLIGLMNLTIKVAQLDALKWAKERHQEHKTWETTKSWFYIHFNKHLEDKIKELKK